MAIQMTREEYKQKYGVPPPQKQESELDDSPTPIRMTREEYNQVYGTQNNQNTAKTVPSFGLNTTGKISDFGNYFENTWESMKASAEKIKKGFSMTKEGAKEDSVTKGIGKMLTGAGVEVSGGLELVFSPITGAIASIGQIPLGKETKEGVPSNVGELTKGIISPIQKASDFLIDRPFVQNRPQLIDNLETLVTVGGTFLGGKEIMEAGGKFKALDSAPVKPKVVSPEVQQYKNLVTKEANKIYKIENSYARKLPDSTTDKGHASRQRIAESGVIDDTIVDMDGLIIPERVKIAANRYAEMTGLNKADDLVMNNLKREGKTINIKQAENALRLGIDDSKLGGADLIKAVRSLDKEIQGLRLRADEFGNIPLWRIQEAKISVYKNIDYGKSTTPTINLRKAKGRVYKELIEDNSKVTVKVNGKDYKIKQINEILGKFIEDVERINYLGGKRVKGGKLGKYFAQVSGNIIGGAAGSAFGGPVGTAIGTIVGGEAAGFLRGKQMQRTFSPIGRGVDKNPVLMKAIAEGKLPKEVNLKIADKKLRAPKGIKKTPEMVKVEARIKKNVEAQKKAIAKGDFDLVLTLKEIYQSLITKLKELIGVSIKNKEGGFVQIQSNKDGNLNTQYNKTAIAKTTAIEPNYTTKLKTKKDIVIRDVAGNKNTILSGKVIKAGQGKGSNMVLSVGDKTYTINKGQFDNLKGQSIQDTAKKFAPELEGTEETVKGGKLNSKTEVKVREDLLNLEDQFESKYGREWKYKMNDNEFTKYQTLKNDLREIASQNYELSQGGKSTKYSSYTLPDGENYREILIKAPVSKKGMIDITRPDGSIVKDIPSSNQIFNSSHWDEPNVISHLRINDRTYNGKKVSFMEELQSDWAREGRDKGFATEITKDSAKQQGFRVDKKKTNMGDEAYFIDNPSDPYMYRKGFPNEGFNTEAEAWSALTRKLKEISPAVPNNPLLKNWQVPTIKRALKDAVDSNAEYFAWINGEQTSARYNLATYIEDVKWQTDKKGRFVELKAKDGKSISLPVDKNGVITDEAGYGNYDKSWEGKKLDEVLGKGLADKIMEKETGTLAGDGLKFGGEWASNLYDKQVKNIVEDLTGAKVKEFDLGLPVEKGKMNLQVWRADNLQDLKPNELKVGLEIEKRGDKYIITDVLGDGKFKAVPKWNYDEGVKVVKSGTKTQQQLKENLSKIEESFDISQKTTKQQGIELTPEVKSIIKGESPLKNGGFINQQALAGISVGVPLIYEIFFNPDRQVNMPKQKVAEASENEPVMNEPVEPKTEKKAVQTEIKSFAPEKYVPVVKEATQEGVISPNALVALINTENGEWKEEFVNPEGTDTGLGQHNDNTYKDINPLFRAKYGRDYDRKNGNDNIKATALWMNHLVQNYPHIRTIDDVVGAYRVGAQGYKRYLEGKGTDAFTPAQLKSMVEDKQKSFREFYNA